MLAKPVHADGMLKTGQSDGARRARRSKATWLDEVRKWKKSGLTAAAYSEQRGLHAGTLAGWASKVRDQLETAPPARGRSARHGQLQFVPVRVAEEDRASVEDTDRAELEIVLCNGRRVRVSAQFDGDALTRVLQIVEGGGRC